MLVDILKLYFNYNTFNYVDHTFKINTLSKLVIYLICQYLKSLINLMRTFYVEDSHISTNYAGNLKVKACKYFKYV